MAVKKCCIEKCKSCTTRKEDKGVTYHKFPKDVTFYNEWQSITHYTNTNKDLAVYVCSRHFCKGDFLKNKDSKYILKPDAVPSIFPWTIDSVNMDTSQFEESFSSTTKDEEKNISSSSKGSEGENLDAIKKFIEEQEKEIQEKKNENENHVINTPEMASSIDEHVTQTSEKNSDIEEQEKEVNQIVSNIEDQDKENPQYKSNIEEREQELQKTDKVPESFEHHFEKVTSKTEDTANVQINVTSSVMDFILSETESKIVEKMYEENVNISPKQIMRDERNDKKNINPKENDKGNSSMSLSVGSKVEVKDFGEDWYSADIAEVDYEEMEVLVRYEIEFKKPDEWISVSSPRLRPFTGSGVKPAVAEDPDPPKEKTEPQAEKAPTVKEKSILKKLLAATAIKEEPILNIKKEDIVKTEEKAKLVFEVGERCLARWRDNRRFVATINRDLGGGQFEIMFDDGFHWTCGISRLSKMKAEKGDFLTVDTSFQSSIMGTPSPVNLGGADTSNAPISPAIPIFHTHLFDPSRDYLGSKSERREKKRKLNIKEIFNIGQKKSKIQKTEIEKAPKPVVERKPRVLKKNAPLKEPRVMLKKEIKMELPDALASIIGTMEDTNQDIKHEPVSDAEDKDEKDTPGKITEGKYLDCDQTAKYTGNTTEKFKEEVEDMDVDTMESISCIVNPNDDTLDDEDSDDPKSDGDPVLEEEVTLENFEKQDAKKHEAVIDKIKEAIIKLEDGISEIEKGQSPKVEKTYTPKLEIALSPILERVLSPNLERACIPKLESDNTLKLESDLSIDIEPSETIEDVKPEELKDILAEVAASINIEESKKSEDNATTDKTVVVKSEVPESKRDISKVKKNKRRKLSHDKTVKRQVEKVKNELEFMKKQFELMRTQMMVQSQEFGQMQDNAPLPESCLRPGEWCCRWVNGQPVGKVSEIESPLQFDADNKPVLPRRSVEVADKRLPAGWTKHMVRRSVGNSAGKWDVVLVGSEEVGNKRFHTKVDMANFLEHCQDKELKQYEDALMDFGVHLKTARRMGWIVNTPDGIAEAPETILPADTTCHLSPLVKRKSLNLKRREERRIMKPKKRGLKMKDKKRRPIKLKLQKGLHTYNSQLVEGESSSEIQNDTVDTMFEPPLMSLEDGYVYVGSLKVQIIDNLLRCPSDVCVKNFRTKTLLQMHIKHYHRELIKMMGATPKVLDLAYARTKPNEADTPQVDKKVIKVKINKPPRREEPKMSMYDLENSMDDFPTTPVKCEGPISSIPRIARSLDSPKVRQALIPKPVRRPRVLLPVRRLEPEQAIPDSMNEDDVFDDSITEPTVEIPLLEQPLDFETAISTHTVTKPLEKKKKGDKKKSFASFSKHISEDEEWFAMNSDELDTRSSFPRSGSPDSKMDGKMVPMSSESTDDQKDPNLYTYTETGERIKIVHMKREEIINCHCGVREEDGLMVQCELCLCWQHALCHNIQRECEVPEKYTCSICLNPRRGRRSMRFVHDQDRLYEGLLPGAKPCETLRRSHELAGNLLRLDGALHALRHKYYVGTKKDHPKLYLWACDWEQAEISYTQEKLNSDYSDLNIMINGIDKENLPVRRDTENEDTDSVPEDDQESDRLSQRDNQLGSQALLSGLLSSPGGASLDLNITTSELERLAKSVQECGDWQRVSAPQPEAAIENEACRARLLQHIQRCQALVDTRLDSIEAQVAELESAEPSFGEHYETAEFYPRTKQTIQMLMRDLDNMEELGVIT